MSRTNHARLAADERAERKAAKRPIIRRRRTATRRAVVQAAIDGRI